MIAKGWDDIFLDLDPGRGLKAGERWQDALRRAAERCELVIILISPGWASSKWCLAEFLLAKSLSKRIFAVIVEPTPFKSLPFEMTSEWQVIDLTAGNRDYLATVTLPPGDRKATVAKLAKEGFVPTSNWTSSGWRRGKAFRLTWSDIGATFLLLAVPLASS